MENYTIYCTPEQTVKALKLGAPLAIYSEEHNNNNINECYITNDIIFMNNENICRNEEFDLVCIIGEKPNRKAYFVPTAEQMIGWLYEQGIAIDIHTYFCVGNSKIHHYQFTVTDSTRVFNGEHSSRKETILYAIDIALDYLSNK